MFYPWGPCFCIDAKALDSGRVNLVDRIAVYHEFFDLPVALKFAANGLELYVSVIRSRGILRARPHALGSMPKRVLQR